MAQNAPVRPRSPRTVLRRVNVRPPRPTASTDAIFILMRRMRGPLVVLLVIFAVDVMGLTLTKLEWERTRPLALNLLMIWTVYQFYGFVELAPTMEEIIPYVWGGTGLLAGTAAAADRS